MARSLSLVAWVFVLVSLSACQLMQPFEREPSSGMTQVRIATSNSYTPLDLMERLQDMNANELDGLSDGQISALGAPMNGGIMVYAVNQADNTTTGFRYLNETDQISYALPNGTYKFYVLGYETGGLASSTNGPQCGFALDGGNALVNLSGGSKTLTASLTIKGSTGNCTNAAFAGFGYATSNFRELEVYGCNAAGYAGATIGSSTCTSNQSTDIASGSIKVRLPALKQPGNIVQNAGMSSPCKTMASSATLTTAIYVPPGAGGPAPAIPVHIDVYSDASCSSFLRTYVMNNGLGVAVPHAKVFTQSVSLIHLYLEDF